MDTRTGVKRAPTMIRLETPRLLLREFTSRDADDLHAMDGDARVMRYLANGLAPRSREACKAALARMSRQYADQPGFGLLHARTRDGDRFVGGCGLFRVPDGDDVEIAYRLPVACWGRGYATEMAHAVLAHAFDMLALDRVIGLTWPENVASQRVLEKAGMVRTGRATYYDREMLVFVAGRRGT